MAPPMGRWALGLLVEDWQDMTGGAGVLRRAGRGGGGGGGGGDHLGARQVEQSLLFEGGLGV